MPVPVLIVLGIAFIIGLVSAGSVGTLSLLHHKRAKAKLKSSPRGVPRPPPGMTRRELIETAEQRLSMNVTRYFNFGLCGGSGAGKSTLINALLNREDVDFVEGKAHNVLGSAPTGNWQTTMKTFCYAYPVGHAFQNVRLWDMPGCGTHEHPSATYFEDKALYAFDVLLIVTEKELGEYEYTILKKAQEQNVPMVIAVTKAEVKVESKIRKVYNTRNPPLADYRQLVEKTSDEARQRVEACLNKQGIQAVPVFIVSAWKYRDFMMDQETLANINSEENTSVQEVCDDVSIGQAAFNQEVNSHEAQPQATAEDEEREKNALLSFELALLLDYIAHKAAQRRL